MSQQSQLISGSFNLPQNGRPSHQVSQQEWLFIDESSTIASPKPKRPCDLSNLLVIVPFPPKVDPSDLIRRNKHGELLARSTNKFLIYRNEFAKQLHSQGYRLSMRENKNKLNGDRIAKQTTNEHEKMQQQFYDKIRLKQETQNELDASTNVSRSVFRENDDPVTNDTQSQQIETITKIIPSQRYDASPILSPIMHFTDIQETQPTYFLEPQTNNNQLFQFYNNEQNSLSTFDNTLTSSQIDNIISFSLSNLSADCFFNLNSAACNNFNPADRNLGGNSAIIVNFGTNSIGNGSSMSYL
ncbi:17282_t:CDS:2 [Gigaspora margarita]|uniref:17282_t:CDS:1 n=1 Tax=Gigaspora margarita TaxID=4874 RepID=A0ABN7UNK6_GIGMA|nr:17282_t:CDS:2 [Gigaspora margarita]